MSEDELRDTAFDGRIKLDGDGAPELEVIVELNDRHLILGHISGELGRWEKDAVRVAPIGRGWFALDVEDEQMIFLPRRPGHFAAATEDLVPVPEEPKKRFRRKARDGRAEKAATPSRKERKRLRREEAAQARLAATETATDEIVAEPVTPPLEQEIDLHPAEPATTPADSPAPPIIPPPVETAPVWVEPGTVPEPEVQPPSPPPRPVTDAAPEPTSPWDDVAVPEVPGRKSRDRKKSRKEADGPPLPLHQKRTKPPREKAPKPKKPVKQTRGGFEEDGSPRKSSRRFAPFLKGIAYRISDELRQTGIVPFDRLPAAPGRARPDDNHEHAFQEHRLPGGLTRNVCHACGLVSIGELSDDD